MKFSAALALSLFASAAVAEPANVNIDVFKATGYVRAPATPADKKAADLPAPASIWNGSAWWQVLTYCSAMHGVQELRLEDGGEPAVAEQRALGRRYHDLAIERLKTDRGIAADAAGKVVEAETYYWTYSFLDQTLNYRLEALTCRFAEGKSKMS
ncbi:MAG: hypothetical protein Q8L23_01200 [Caulobacter sp.]|nr:hypothetical protein [Caulobacter sp.]